MATDKSQKSVDGSHSTIVHTDEKRLEYLLVCFQSAREELLLRFKYREDWLKLQLLSQVVLLALSQGIEIVGVKTSSSIPDVLALSTTVSGMFASLYYIDDSLITYIGNYLGAITDAEARLRPGSWKILNWDSSAQVHHYVRSALPVKYLAQLIAFVIIPTGLVVWRMSKFPSWNALQLSELIVHIIFLSLIGYLVLRGYWRRRDAFLGEKRSILKPAEQRDDQL